MSWDKVIEEVPKTIPVLLGGFIASASGVVGHYVTHRLSRQRERSRLFREKAEQLVGLLYEHRDWVRSENNRLTFGNDIPELPSPLDRAYAIQALYFPEVRKSLDEMTNAIKPMIQYFYANAEARLKEKEKWIANFDGKEFQPLYENYLKAFHVTVKEVVEAALRRIEAD